MQVKALKTQRYAQANPALPQIQLFEGKVYELPEVLANKVIDSGGGVEYDADEKVKAKPKDSTEPAQAPIVSVSSEETANDDEASEAVEIETKEKPKKRGRPKKSKGD